MKDRSIFSTLADTALENPIVVKRSTSIQRGDVVFFLYRVNAPSRFPLRLTRLRVNPQFVLEAVSDRSQKNSNLVLPTGLHGRSSASAGNPDDKYKPKPSNPMGSRHCCNIWQNCEMLVHDSSASVARRMLMSLAITWRAFSVRFAAHPNSRNS